MCTNRHQKKKRTQSLKWDIGENRSFREGYDQYTFYLYMKYKKIKQVRKD